MKRISFVLAAVYLYLCTTVVYSIRAGVAFTVPLARILILIVKTLHFSHNATCSCFSRPVGIEMTYSYLTTEHKIKTQVKARPSTSDGVVLVAMYV